MADAEGAPRGDGGTTWLLGLVVVVVLGLVLWFTVLRSGGADDDADIKIELNAPGGEGGRGNGSPQ